MLLKALTFMAIAGVCTFAQSRNAKALPQQDSLPALRTCGIPEVRDQPRYIEHFGNYWLQQDAKYLITDPERNAYKMLSNDEERENFIKNFWYRRDPTPDTIENEFKDEHYRRIVYANQHFAWRVPGWRTDRGRIYIIYGPPDSIESTTPGALKEKDGEKLAEALSAPVEVWQYRYLQGIGQEVKLQFIDVCRCGDFHMRADTRGFLMQFACPQDGLSVCPDRKPTNDRPDPILPKPSTQIVKQPQVRFKDLEEIVTTKVRYNALPFGTQTSAVRATESTDWVSLTLQFQNRDLSWKKNGEKPSVNLHVYARFTTLTGRIAQTVEEEIKAFDDLCNGKQDSANGTIQFSRSLALPAGRYRLDIAVHDLNADKVGTRSQGLIVPDFYADNLETSPMIVAEQIDARPHYAHPDSGELYVGDVRIHPRLAGSDGKPAVFHPGEQLHLFLQAYNLSVSTNTAKPDAVITYKIVNAASAKIVVEHQETNTDLTQVREQITIQKSVSLTGVPKGEYYVCVTVNDLIAHRSSTSSAMIVIE